MTVTKVLVFLNILNYINSHNKKYAVIKRTINLHWNKI